MGAHGPVHQGTWADYANRMRPERLFHGVREEVGPDSFHTHDTSGINAASILKRGSRRPRADAAALR